MADIISLVLPQNIFKMKKLLHYMMVARVQAIGDVAKKMDSDFRNSLYNVLVHKYIYSTFWNLNLKF
jgi:hypothetical protein